MNDPREERMTPFLRDLLGMGLPDVVLVAAVMQKTGLDEDMAREMIAVETTSPHGDLITLPEDPDLDAELVPFYVRTSAERERWHTCWELALKMLCGEDLGGWRPMIARQLYASDIPTG